MELPEYVWQDIESTLRGSAYYDSTNERANWRNRFLRALEIVDMERACQVRESMLPSRANSKGVPDADKA